MKTFKNITSDGIAYIDEVGAESFIDFKKCNENWIQCRKRTEHLNDETAEKVSRNDKSIGQRDICGSPPFIEFFTYPKFTRFEFNQSIESQDKEKSFTELQRNIALAGWTTIDLS